MTNINYVSIREVESRILRHPLMQEVTLEQVVQYTVDFVSTVGLPKMYEDREDRVEIHDHIGQLPCYPESIRGVLNDHGVQLNTLTSVFQEEDYNPEYHKDAAYSRVRPQQGYKLQGNNIVVSQKEGWVIVAYRALYQDDDGLPLLPDDGVFMQALELYIKDRYFTILFDMGKIGRDQLYNTQQEYSFKVGQLRNKYNIPSPAEMESFTNMWNQLVPRTNEFIKGFRYLGTRERFKVQR